MKGAQGRKNPAQRVLEGLGGFGRRASGLILPGKALKAVEDEEKRDRVKRFREHKKRHISTFVIDYGRTSPLTKRDHRRAGNERHAANKRARVARRRNRV